MRLRCRPSRSVLSSLCLTILLSVSSNLGVAQVPAALTPLETVPPIAFDNSGPVLRERTTPTLPVTVAGPHGALIGQQSGYFESWILPVKLISHFTIEANVEGYGVPIDVNQQSAEIEVRPDRTIITYTHPTFTVRQIMFSPGAAPVPPSLGAPSLPSASAEERVGDNSNPTTGPAQTGPVVLFEFDCLHPTDFTFRFIPELKWMWPERNEGVPGPEWVSTTPHDTSSAGFYILHTDYPNLAGAITIPGATHGILAPYQERPEFHPLELNLHIDPARDKNKLYPLLMAAGITPASATNAALASTLAQLDSQIPALYAAHAESWTKLLAHSTSISTPDSVLNEAFQWAVVSIEQLKTPTIPNQSSPPTDGASRGLQASESASTERRASALDSGSNQSRLSAPCRPVSSPTLRRVILRTGAPGAPAARECGWGKPGEGSAVVPAKVAATTEAPPETRENETALIAGYYTSADTARPGFGWFFGRDALYTLYAVNGYGDFALSRSELEFLIHRQRADGKIMHEYAQTAAAIDWQAFPYMYAAADSTPLFLMAVADYVRSSGNSAFLTTYRNAIEKAWAFETDPAHDTDHDGIYDNSQGTGWVESWPTGMPHQEIYLALLDQQASSAMAWIENQLNDSSEAENAKHRADTLVTTINQEYSLPAQGGCYAFSRNLDGSQDRTTTVYPALAWWDPANNKPILNNPDPCLRNFVASALNTDWGLRDVANTEPLYDGLSYHQGSVWPLFTGWAALAEYRANQPLAGYQLLMENANLTRASDLGAVTELLSGDFFVPFGRSTSHQLWSSAMVITPTLRGLFGISIDAQSKTITVNPHLPAGWAHAEIVNLPLPSGGAWLRFDRKGSALEVRFTPTGDDQWKIRSDLPGAHAGSLPLFDGAQKATIAPLEGLTIPLPAVEIDDYAKPYGDAAIAQASWPLKKKIPGDRTSNIRILHEEYGERTLTLTFEGEASSDGVVSLFRNSRVEPQVSLINDRKRNLDKPEASVSYRDCDANPYECKTLPLVVHFPPGTGFQTLTVTLTW